MSKLFKHRCARRTTQVPSQRLCSQQPVDPHEQVQGAGSGGGGDPTPGEYSSAHASYAGGHYTIHGEEVEITACAGQPYVSIEAFVQEYADGLAFVQIHGDKGIRVGAGPTIQVRDIALDGIEVFTDDNKHIVFTRGQDSSNPQQLAIETDGFLIDANLAGMVIQSMHSITIQVAGGTSSITLTPEGITVVGPMININ